MVSTQLKIISQIRNLPQIGVKIKNYLKPPPSIWLATTPDIHCVHFSPPRIFSNDSTLQSHTWCVMTPEPRPRRPAHVNLQTVGHGTSTKRRYQVPTFPCLEVDGKWLHETALENEDFCWTPKMEGLEHAISGFQFQWIVRFPLFSLSGVYVTPWKTTKMFPKKGHLNNKKQIFQPLISGDLTSCWIMSQKQR